MHDKAIHIYNIRRTIKKYILTLDPHTMQNLFICAIQTSTTCRLAITKNHTNAHCFYFHHTQTYILSDTSSTSLSISLSLTHTHTHINSA